MIKVTTQCANYIQEWGDLPVSRLREMIKATAGNRTWLEAGLHGLGHWKRGDCLAFLLEHYPD